MRKRLKGFYAAPIICCLVTACSSSAKTSRIQTITESAPASSSPSTSTSTSSSSSSSAPVTPSSTTSAQTRLPGSCESLLSVDQIDQAAGSALAGTTAFVVGVPEPDIHRLAYLNCRYGIVNGVPKIEVGISLYDTPTHAADRIQATTDDYASHGATATPVTVSGHAGQQLSGASGAGYTGVTVAVASGPRTVAVTVQSSIASTAATAQRIAGIALDETGG